MPFQSKAQQKYAYANPDVFGGESKLKEWSADTNFDTLPEKKSKKKNFSYAPKSRASYTKDQRAA